LENENESTRGVRGLRQNLYEYIWGEGENNGTQGDKKRKSTTGEKGSTEKRGFKSN